MFSTSRRLVLTALNEQKNAGDYSIQLEMGQLPPGKYVATAVANGSIVQTLKLLKVE